MMRLYNILPSLKRSGQSASYRAFPFHRSAHSLARSSMEEGDRFWRHTPWKEYTPEQFNNYEWQRKATVTKIHLPGFLDKVLPKDFEMSTDPLLQSITSKEAFIDDTVAALKLAPMAVRITPYVLSRIDWSNPVDDPIRKQILPLASAMQPDHEKLTLDSLHEQKDSPVPGLVHRYPGKALFLATSVCPVSCRFCTRSWAVGPDTPTVSKKTQIPSPKRWENMFQYIETHPELQDIVVSGGDAYELQPKDLRMIGERLLGMEHIRRIRFASRGPAINPARIQEGEPWTEALIHLSQQGRSQGKEVCLHTHFEHPKEITWVTKNAANYLYKHGVTVRNQAVLLKGVNNSFTVLSELVQSLANMNIQPYYVYQCDMVKGIEDLRVPLGEMLRLEAQIQGSLAGFMTPKFVVDLPGGGGKRLASTFEKYENGVATFTAPILDKGNDRKLYYYHDPKVPGKEELKALRDRKSQALENNTTL